MQSCDLAIFVTTVACSLTKCFPEEELPLLAAVFTQLGDTIVTITTQQELCEARNEKNKKEENNKEENDKEDCY